MKRPIGFTHLPSLLGQKGSLTQKNDIHSSSSTRTSSKRPCPAVAIVAPLQSHSWNQLDLPQTSLILSSENNNGITTPQTFEPVLNVPALGSFLFIMIMALLLRLRINAIANAAESRISALDQLRQVKRQELNSNSTTEQVEQAIANYKMALETEENLRTLLPGVRLRAPNNPNQSELDIQAARQFLGVEPSNTTATQLVGGIEDEPANFPVPVLITLWTFIFTSLITLFFFLSMDDDTANSVFNTMSFNDSGEPVVSTVAETIGEIVSNE